MTGIVTKTNKWVAAGIETNYGGGYNGVAKAMTAWSNAHPPSALDILNTFDLGYSQFGRTKIRDVGASAMQQTAVLAQQVEYEDPELHDICAQTVALLTLATQDVTAGSAVTHSWTIVGSDGLKDVQSYGSILQHYELHGKINDFITQDVVFKHYQSSEAAIALTPVAFTAPSTGPLVFNDLGIAYNAGGYDIQSLDLTIDKTFAGKDNRLIDLGDYYQQQAILVKVDVTLELGFTDSALAALLEPKLKTEYNVDVSDIVLTLPYVAASKTLTLHGLYVDEKGLNDLSHEDDDVKNFKVTLANGTAFTMGLV